ncbi:MAG: class F sortase [Jatrophihabitans sp.]|uniref:class F sortase n=1 Tax=Jatrophihabitans sp. TaxID=1932789 RepID=UPI003F8231E4
MPVDATGGGPRAAAAPLPTDLTGSVPPPSSTAPPAPDGSITSTSAASTSAPAPTPAPGVPVAISIPWASANHPHGVHARIGAHDLEPNGALYVPADPRDVSWARQDAMPGAATGTAILTSHIDYVIDGRTVAGAFADLAEYAHDAIGRRFTVTLADGRTLAYRVTAGREYRKDQLAADPSLRRALFDQTSAFGPASRPSGRLLLVSCGGAFDPDTGSYEDNVFLYALPA